MVDIQVMDILSMLTSLYNCIFQGGEGYYNHIISDNPLPEYMKDDYQFWEYPTTKYFILDCLLYFNSASGGGVGPVIPCCKSSYHQL